MAETATAGVDRQVRVGHWTSPDARTGCTVICLPQGTVASGEVRGGAPATRDFELLDPRRLVQHVDAVVLTGGSAFGLATADGVMSELAAIGRGFATRAGPVPIVVGLGLFDLGEQVICPGADHGAAAWRAATVEFEVGRVGAGAGATVGKWRDPAVAIPGGLGTAQVRVGELTVSALVAVNAAGDIDDGQTVAKVLGGTFEPASIAPAFENTSIGVIWTNAALDKLTCRQVAESGHDGLGRALVPAHSASDGDALVVAATGELDSDVATVRLLAAIAVEQAVRQVGNT